MNEAEIQKIYEFTISLPEGVQCKQYLSKMLQQIYRYRTYQKTIDKFVENKDSKGLMEFLTDKTIYAEGMHS